MGHGGTKALMNMMPVDLETTIQGLLPGRARNLFVARHQPCLVPSISTLPFGHMRHNNLSDKPA